jgi:hypothetical protein
MQRNVDRAESRYSRQGFTPLPYPVALGSQPPSLLGWWYWLVALPEPRLGATLGERERTRHAHLVAIFLLAFVFIEAGGLFQFGVIDNDHPLMIALLVIAFAIMILIAGLNRTGRITAAGLLMVALADISLPSIPATGAVDLQHFGAIYLSVGSLLVAASVLPAWTVFPLAIVNCSLVLGIISFLPHSTAFDAVLRSNDAQQVLAGPLLMQIIVALVAYLWAHSMLNALRRADRAEEVAFLEKRELDRQAELEEGVRRLLEVHVRLANGDFQVRASGLRSPLLWSVGNSLNFLIARLARTAQADHVLRLEEEEAKRLADAISLARSGQQPFWPAPTGAPLDIVLEALRSRPLVMGSGSPAPIAGSSRAPERSEGRQAVQNGNDPRNDLPEWLRPPS